MRVNLTKLVGFFPPLIRPSFEIALSKRKGNTQINTLVVVEVNFHEIS